MNTMLSKFVTVLVSFLFIATNATPITQHEHGFENDGLEKSFDSDYPKKRQLLLNEPELSHDLPLYSEGAFDSYGHHLPGQYTIQLVMGNAIFMSIQYIDSKYFQFIV